MKPSVRVALACLFCALWGTGVTADYPEKPVTLVIPLSGGGSHDLNAQIITSVIPAYLEQEMVVSFQPGDKGVKGTAMVADATPDGYTLLFSQNYIDMMLPHVEDLPYDPLEDFVPIARINYAPSVVVVRADSPYQTFEDLIDAAGANPDTVSASHSGEWGAIFVPIAQIMKQFGVKFELHSYQGGGPSFAALLAGDVDFTLAFPASVADLMESGAVRVLATAGSERLFLDVPCFPEVGIKGDVGFMHRMILAPAATDPAVVDRLSSAFEAMLDDHSYVYLMGNLGENVDLLGPQDYQQLRVEQHRAYKALFEATIN
ncbi:MAG: tripartite tricarboxylate transporter substrate binding protein [Pseudomonadota bacterium]